MKYQTNPELGAFINHWGCHFESILEKVEKRTGTKFTNDEVIFVYKQAIINGNLQKEVRNNAGTPIDGCTVLDGDGNGFADGDKIFNIGSELKKSPVRAVGYRKESKNYIPKSNEEEILELKRNGYLGSHFVSGNGIISATNWRHEIEFDPIEGGSQCARLGWIESKRILTFKE